MSQTMCARAAETLPADEPLLFEIHEQQSALLSLIHEATAAQDQPFPHLSRPAISPAFGITSTQGFSFNQHAQICSPRKIPARQGSGQMIRPRQPLNAPAREEASACGAIQGELEFGSGNLFHTKRALLSTSQARLAERKNSDGPSTHHTGSACRGGPVYLGHPV